jgi:uncharacterized protein (DUF2267 family)
MQYDEFIQRVQIEGGIDSSEEALRATEAVLSALGECLYRTEESQLAAQLPRGIGEFLTSRQPPETSRANVRPCTLDDFYNRVGARTDKRHAQAVKLARTVTEVLMDAVSTGEIDGIKRELPREFAVLFDRGI